MKNLFRATFIGLICFIGMSPMYAQNRVEQTGSNHSLSLTTMYGIEYGYEYKWDNGMSLIGRVGVGSELYASSKVYFIDGKGFKAMLEPRYYLNDEDFFSLKVGGTVLIPNTPYTVSIVPVYGIQRDFSKHWFCEFTVGGGVGYYSGNNGSLYFKPHLQFRIGFRL